MYSFLNQRKRRSSLDRFRDRRRHLLMPPRHTPEKYAAEGLSMPLQWSYSQKIWHRISRYLPGLLPRLYSWDHSATARDRSPVYSPGILRVLCAIDLLRSAKCTLCHLVSFATTRAYFCCQAIDCSFRLSRYLYQIQSGHASSWFLSMVRWRSLANLSCWRDTLRLSTRRCCSGASSGEDWTCCPTPCVRNSARA